MSAAGPSRSSRMTRHASTVSCASHGTQDDEAGDRAQRREVLDGLVRRAVLAQRDGVVREDPRDVQPHERRQADRAAHVVGELQERRAVRADDAAVGRHPVDGRAHRVLADAEEDVAARPSRAVKRSESGKIVFVDSVRSAAPPSIVGVNGSNAFMTCAADAARRDLRLVEASWAARRPCRAAGGRGRPRRGPTRRRGRRPRSRQASKRSFHSACALPPSSVMPNAS